MQTSLNDPIDVVVSFAHNRVQPRVMRWNGREYKIERVNLVHSAREGAKRLFFFSVSDSTNAFKLKLDTDLLEWRLVELGVDG
jgi:galactose mutarotase-like enzyme